jgi:import receptor subunit TOM70
MLLKRGRRHVYDRRYDQASSDFEEAYGLVSSDADAQEAMEGGDGYARLLEWTGMVRHWHYNLDSACQCYQRCSDLEPINTNVLVKQAGVQMDAGKHDDALKLFDTALGIDPGTVDALLHRSNLRMLQSKPDEARRDLEACLKLRPNHVMARLRLASILSALGDQDGAARELDMAEREDPNSSEVQSYRGELYFTQGKMDEARERFERAIELEPSNPTPYVNLAMAVLNTPPENPGQPPDTAAVMSHLEKAIEADPQFTAAYVQLGQLALASAVDLVTAREVIKLYDQALANCRTPEEVNEICSMRVLAVAQVEAATALNMDTFSMQ